LEIDPILLVAAFAGGYIVSRWQCRYYWLINMALRAELIGMRRRVYCDKTSKDHTIRPKNLAGPELLNILLISSCPLKKKTRDTVLE